MAIDNEEPVERTAEQARGGSTPGVTRYILGVSVVLVIVIFAAILLL